MISKEEKFDLNEDRMAKNIDTVLKIIEELFSVLDTISETDPHSHARLTISTVTTLIINTLAASTGNYIFELGLLEAVKEQLGNEDLIVVRNPGQRMAESSKKK